MLTRPLRALAFVGGRITAITHDDPPDSAAHAHDVLDLDGDFLIPGLVDLHTDNLERQVEPRANARWPSRAAMLAHDAQCAAAGVTTVLDALCLGELGLEESRTRTFRDGLADGDALHDTGLLRAEHFLHLRCELPAAGLPGEQRPAIVVIVESTEEDPIDAERLDALVSQLKPAHVLHRIQINEG